MERRKGREITEYTFLMQGADGASWYRSAISFHEGANILAKHKDLIEDGIRVFLVNVALSLELLLKAILVAKGKEFPKIHKLRALAEMAEVDFTTNQRATLELLEQIFMWRGRYPVPKDDAVWDDYHDRILEQHIIIESTGNTHRTRANPETFPSERNCDALWIIANRKWNEIQPR